MAERVHSDSPSPEFLRSGLKTAALEGPVPDGHGGIYVSDLSSGVLHIAHGRARTIIADRPKVGGLARIAGGHLVVTGPSVEVFDVSGGRADLVGVVFDRSDLIVKEGTTPWFNDLAVDHHGRLWIGVIRTDQHGDRVPGEIYVLDPNGDVQLVTDDVYPNGIAICPTTDIAYCSDTFRRRVVAIDTESLSVAGSIDIPSGSDGLPDGVAVDAEGYLWIALWRSPNVIRMSATGRLDLVWKTDAWAYSLAFDPADPYRLWIVTGPDPAVHTSYGDVLSTRVDVPGVPGFDAPKLSIRSL